MDHKVGQVDNEEVVLNYHGHVDVNVVDDDLGKSLLGSVVLGLDLLLEPVGHLDFWGGQKFRVLLVVPHDHNVRQNGNNGIDYQESHHDAEVLGQRVGIG